MRANTFVTCRKIVKDSVRGISELSGRVAIETRFGQLIRILRQQRGILGMTFYTWSFALRS